jgi:hypothetical protein
LGEYLSDYYKFKYQIRFLHQGLNERLGLLLKTIAKQLRITSHGLTQAEAVCLSNGLPNKTFKEMSTALY